jgi:hypothetical protein
MMSPGGWGAARRRGIPLRYAESAFFHTQFKGGLGALNCSFCFAAYPRAVEFLLFWYLSAHLAMQSFISERMTFFNIASLLFFLM